MCVGRRADCLWFAFSCFMCSSIFLGIWLSPLWQRAGRTAAVSFPEPCLPPVSERDGLHVWAGWQGWLQSTEKGIQKTLTKVCQRWARRPAPQAVARGSGCGQAGCCHWGHVAVALSTATASLQRRNGCPESHRGCDHPAPGLLPHRPTPSAWEGARALGTTLGS